MMLGIIPTELLYLSIFFCCILVGYIGRSVPAGKPRLVFYGLLGGLSMLGCSRSCFCTLLILFAGNYSILKTAQPKNIPLVSFLFAFSVLGTLRLIIRLGWLEFSEVGNVAILLTTLRVVSSAYEIADLAKLTSPQSQYWAMQRKNESVELSHVDPVKYKNHFVPLDFLTLLCYTYSLLGLFSGPFYTYRCFWHMVHRSDFSRISIKTHSFPRLRTAFICLPLYLFLNSVFPHQFMVTPGFDSSSFLWKYLYAGAVFTVFRLRFYAAWTVAELACVTSGLGAYPSGTAPKIGYGPTKFEETEGPVSFETIASLDIFKCESVPTVKEALVAWNMTVQWWLYYTVYSRLVNYRRFVTTFVSCFWHGIHAGYYLGMMYSPLCAVVEIILIPPALKVIPVFYHEFFYWVLWVNRVGQFSFMAVAFILLESELILAVWRSMHYFAPVSLAFLLVLSLFIRLCKHSS